VGDLEYMKRGSGIKDRDDRSSGIEILIVDVFVKIKLDQLLHGEYVKQKATKIIMTEWTTLNFCK